MLEHYLTPLTKGALQLLAFFKSRIRLWMPLCGLGLIAGILLAWTAVGAMPLASDHLAPMPSISRGIKETEDSPLTVPALAVPTQDPTNNPSDSNGSAAADQYPSRQGHRENLALARIRAESQLPQADPTSTPIYDTFDFLRGYLTNLTYPIIVPGKPWDYGSTNMVQLHKSLGGTSFWDFWGESEPWNSPNHLWRDDQGNWHTYKTETITDPSGQTTTAYVLLAKNGPGVMDKLWFTHDAVTSFLSVLGPSNALNFLTADPPDLTSWGDLSKLGNLRIEVDGNIVFDGPVETWFSGDAQNLSPDLKKIFVWRYQQFGSDGNIIPIPYQKHIKVSVYGGTGKPKWFMATGITLPPGTLVKSYTGNPSDLPLDEMESLAQNVLHPEQFIDTLNNNQSIQLTVEPGSPAAIGATGSGVIGAIQFKLSKQYDPRSLWLRVLYGNDVGIDLPLLAFFSEPDRVSLHDSAPIGLIDAGDSYLFYSNMPMPYQNGIRIELSTNGSSDIPITVQIARTTADTYNTQLRVLYKPSEKLQVNGPDFVVDVPGNGKLVGLVLVTQDQGYDEIPIVTDKKTGKEDPATRKWPMGYLEGNLTVSDGVGNTRYYSGQEDWAEGGYYFNSGYTLPPGGSNRPFGGILSYEGGVNGYATLFRYFNDLSAFPFANGLHLSFQHGTWENNFPVSYAATVLYYRQVPGMTPSVLPASNYLSAAPISMSRTIIP